MDLRDLYQELILDHNLRPRNFGVLPGANRTAQGHNPMCGDRITLYLDIEDDIVEGISFEGAGCAISTASASMMTETLRGKTTSDAHRMFERVLDMLTGDPGVEADAPPELGKLAVFTGVREYPVRVKCASLPWHTLAAALENRQGAISTEEHQPQIGESQA